MRNKRNKVLILIVCLVFLVTAVLTKGFGLIRSNLTSPTATNINGSIIIPVSDITNSAKWYEYDSGTNAIKFFIVKTSDGSIKTAFDACDVCYAQKKGYRQEGDYMICNNCGNRYPINGLGTENKIPGGCWPGHLSNIIKGDNIVIEKSDLENNQWRSL